MSRDIDISGRRPDNAGMNTTDAIRHFGTVAALAEALGIKRQAVYQWGDRVPEQRAYQLQVITAGALRVRQPHLAPTDSPAP